ncbi:hypothetical protein AB395_00002278 [Sinorhizobium fredii CCBAU 45436]|nr:hypothetical protein AB395_00002278 [Sinorhizobium fredii CCBAU 45436]
MVTMRFEPAEIVAFDGVRRFPRPTPKIPPAATSLTKR